MLLSMKVTTPSCAAGFVPHFAPSAEGSVFMKYHSGVRLAYVTPCADW